MILKNLGEQYRKDTDEKLDDRLLQSILNKMDESKFFNNNLNYKLRFGTLIVITVTMMLFGTVAFAYINKIGLFKSTYQGHYRKNAPNVKVVDKKVSNNNINVTIKNYVGDTNASYLTIEVSTKDGSPLQTNEKDKQSIIVGEKFKEAYLLCEGERYNVRMLRTDDAAIGSRATYEIFLPTELNGKKVQLVLKDFTDVVVSTSEIGFTFKNLGELFKQAIPADSSYFTKDRFVRYLKDEKGNIIGMEEGDFYYKFASGNMKIHFTNLYPEAYIDNFGFYKSGSTDDPAFYVSIVPGNQKNEKALKKLCFKNVHTNTPVYSDQMQFLDYYEIPSDGRIILKLDKRYDGTLAANYATTIADLDNYTFATNPISSTFVRERGSWKIDFDLKLTDTSKTFAINQSFSFEGVQFKIDEITLSTSSLSIKAHRNNPDIRVHNAASFVMKDGTEVPVGVKMGGGDGDSIGSWNLDWSLETLIDVNEVVALKIWGQTIELK
ncbi:MAG: hypothetical protein K0R71_875 [Bacillales bacterium]|jgi:hypothetical protein|nr:hypothetical protein [Bacillales bacterium]